MSLWISYRLGRQLRPLRRILIETEITCCGLPSAGDIVLLQTNADLIPCRILPEKPDR